MPDIPSSSNIYPLRECSVQRVPRHVVGIIPVISNLWASILGWFNQESHSLSPSPSFPLHFSHLPLLTPVTGLPSHPSPLSLFTSHTTHSSLVTPPPSHSCHWTPFSPSPSFPLHFSHYSLLTTHSSHLPLLTPVTGLPSHLPPLAPLHFSHYSTQLTAFLIRKHATCVCTGCVERYTAADDFTYRDTCLLH